VSLLVRLGEREIDRLRAGGARLEIIAVDGREYAARSEEW